MKCLMCGADKHQEEFPLDQVRPSGRHPYCRPCKASGQRIRNQRKTKDRWSRYERTCVRCFSIKPVSEFITEERDQDRFIVICKQCKETSHQAQLERKRQKAKAKYAAGQMELKTTTSRRREIMKQALLDRLGGACKDCGLVAGREYPPACFDFHHLDPKAKDLTISKIMTALRKHRERVECELNKCVILCSNCHRRRHFSLGGSRHGS